MPQSSSKLSAKWSFHMSYDTKGVWLARHHVTQTWLQFDALTHITLFWTTADLPWLWGAWAFVWLLVEVEGHGVSCSGFIDTFLNLEQVHTQQITNTPIRLGWRRRSGLLTNTYFPSIQDWVENNCGLGSRGTWRHFRDPKKTKGKPLESNWTAYLHIRKGATVFIWEEIQF